MISDRNRSGDEAAGEESTFTRLAEAVASALLTSEWKSRYCFVRESVYIAFRKERIIKVMLSRKHYQSHV
jgi:hypothetical protein